ncbi:MAG TPA: serpin family protein [Candidatus Thermoplasmatota archaeon]|nr:serpin family protein [Candidatus Thermoplasmatota archaeon]
MKTKFALVIIVSFLLISSSIVFVLMNQSNISDKNTSNETPDDLPSLTAMQTKAYVKTINDFSFNFFKQLYQNPSMEDNLFYSPYSVFTALAMTYEGAKEKTANEMAEVLNIPQDNESFHSYVHSLYTYLNKDSEYTISTANALWIRENYQILNTYLDTVETYYQATSQRIDFSKPAQAAELINQWVENNTNNLIQELISPGNIDPDLCRLILTNAIYFNGTWKVQFDEANTTDREFELPSGENTIVSTMILTGTEDKFNYTETEELQLLELPYAGNEISMIIGLPKEEVPLSTVINDLNETKYKAWFDSMEKEEVNIFLPKFKIETPLLNLNQPLQALGIQKAFTTGADFSGITGNKDLHISDVLHKAYIDVNEKGTEAAAATAVIMRLTSNGGTSSRITFDCDHPFFFMLQHKETGTILFMGTVEHPAYNS